jgi:site-specific DNA-methyltransferase (adenine-specific)
MGESGAGPLSLPRLEDPEDLLHGDALVLGDGLEVARILPQGCLDLVYLDPPFGSGTARRALKGRGGRFGLGERVVYDDPGGAGLSPWLQALLVELRRVLRPGGALFLHLDWRLAHHARVFLDRVFGEEHFLNEIVWHYTTGGIPTRWFARKHDTILYYRNGPGHTFHRQREIKRLKHRVARPGVVEFQDAAGWYRYRFLDDVWEIPWLTQDAGERTGYPSQKPLALLLRILDAVTDPGMRVADFCGGSGTTAAAARRLGRRWISADSAPLAVQIARARLEADIGPTEFGTEPALRVTAASQPPARTGKDFLVVEVRRGE